MFKREIEREMVRSSFTARGPARRAFTLIELLVVLLILTLVIAITIPALGGARNAAKSSATKQLLTRLQQAIASFEQDNGRLPGYFRPQEMGHRENENPDRGFTMMENIMLDLAGGVSDGNPIGPEIMNVGPSTNAQVDVDLGSFGRAERAYFDFDQSNFIAQDGSEGGEQITDPAWRAIPDLVDAWDNPVLAWIGNESAKGPVSDPGWAASGNPQQLFLTRQNSGSSGAELAHFYWASNAGFLNSTRLGRTGRDQEQLSILGGADKAKATESLMAVLGSPSNSNIGKSGVGANDVYPTAPRSSVFLHSAGPDGSYFAKNDSKGRAVISSGGVLEYARTWFSGNSRLLNEDGQPTNQDLITNFDDITLSGGI
jgi:prepilin-type N-terminal cleavage/methylation domain-containing protein